MNVFDWPFRIDSLQPLKSHFLGSPSEKAVCQSVIVTVNLKRYRRPDTSHPTSRVGRGGEVH
jgi:hypothetical protein